VSQDAVRVMVVDDHRVFSEGLSLLLGREPDIEVIGVVTNAEDALVLANEAGPDVVLMDIDLPGTNGIDATRELRRRCREVQVVVLSASQGVEQVAAALDAGAIGYLPKSHAADALVRSIRAAVQGQTTVPDHYLGPVLAELQARRERDRTPPVGHDLTPREREVLRHLAEGLLPSEIAACLHVSVFTLRGHVRGILKKLEVRSIAQAVSKAHREGLTGS
jgi:two-component system, NarL family, response regulator LiaR